MLNYEITEKDIKNNYFHFTKMKNLKKIKENGLIPKVGIHAQSLEKTKKVFFVEGLDNLLILFDCWLNVIIVYPHIPGMYNLGCFFIKYKWFPKIIATSYFKYAKFNKFHKYVAYKYFDNFLKNRILLNIDLEENKDFSFDDIDQIKAKKYNKKYLIEAGYSLKYSDLETIKMDKWNLHTFSNVGVSKEKIKLCYVNDSYKMKDIFNYALKNTKLDLKDMCPILYDYLVSRNLV